MLNKFLFYIILQEHKVFICFLPLVLHEKKQKQFQSTLKDSGKRCTDYQGKRIETSDDTFQHPFFPGWDNAIYKKHKGSERYDDMGPFPCLNSCIKVFNSTQTLIYLNSTWDRASETVSMNRRMRSQNTLSHRLLTERNYKRDHHCF